MKWSLYIEEDSPRFKLNVQTRFEAQGTGLYGHSGSGKTSLLEHILGLRPQADWRGSLTLDDTILQDSTRRVFLAAPLRQLAWAPQKHLLFPHLNVLANVTFSLSRGRSQDDATLSLEEVIDGLELRPLLEVRPRMLSGGESQRVALARALLHPARALLLDEPLSSLDPRLKERAIRLIHRRMITTPIIFVSHSWSDITALCDHVLVFEQGRLIESRAPGVIDSAP